MSTRRGFLALIGGSLVSGTVVAASTNAKPVLLLPPTLSFTPTPAMPGPSEMFYPLCAGHESDMHALAHIKQMMPWEPFYDWLEGGLRGARHYNGRSQDVMAEIVDAAIAKHGSIIAARRAGAL
jgi:hypothetical protein